MKTRAGERLGIRHPVIQGGMADGCGMVAECRQQLAQATPWAASEKDLQDA